MCLLASVLLDPPANVTASGAAPQAQLGVSWLPPPVRYIDDSLMYQVGYAAADGPGEQVGAGPRARPSTRGAQRVDEHRVAGGGGSGQHGAEAARPAARHRLQGAGARQAGRGDLRRLLERLERAGAGGDSAGRSAAARPHDMSVSFPVFMCVSPAEADPLIISLTLIISLVLVVLSLSVFLSHRRSVQQSSTHKHGALPSARS